MAGSSRSRLLSIAILAAIVLGFVLLPSRRPQRPVGVTLSGDLQTPDPAATPRATGAATAPDSPTPLFGERILEHYADPSRPPDEDLQAMARTLENFALLVKGDNPLPLGANEEIAAALRGKNRGELRSLPDDHRAFNSQGQLVDRWGSPLYFHAQSRDRLEIRSAGPDRQMWTADDLHRKHDGRFLHGEALLAPSLFDASTRRPR
ncbi:MAG: hypothetical protein ABMA01_18575 [Chthoniobacteraceae bacterium]